MGSKDLVKSFPGTTVIFGERLWRAINHPKHIKQWLVRGRMVLLSKDGKLYQYHPIVCLIVLQICATIVPLMIKA